MAFHKRRLLRTLTGIGLGISLLCTGGGCGYQFRADGRPVGIEIQSLAIPMVTSTSSDLAFEPDFTRVIREEFISYGKISIVSQEKAQAVLTGHVYDIAIEPLAYRITQPSVGGRVVTHEVTKASRLRMKLDMKLIDRTTGRVIWHEKAMEEKASFNVGDDPLASRYNQRQALERISRQLAKRIFLKTMERF